MVLTVEVDLYLLNLKGTGSLPIIKVQIDGIEMPELLAQAATNQAEPLVINQYFFLSFFRNVYNTNRKNNIFQIHKALICKHFQVYFVS